MVKEIWRYVYSIRRMHESEGRTDGQTYGRTDTAPRHRPRLCIPVHSTTTSQRLLYRRSLEGVIIGLLHWPTQYVSFWISALYYCKGNSSTSNNMKLVHWPLLGGLLHLVQPGATGWCCNALRPLLAVPNVTAHPSTASVPITVLLYSGPLLCGFNTR